MAKDKKQKLVPVTIKWRDDKQGGHNQVILENIDNKHVSVGLTTKASKGKGSTNYKLENDPLGKGKTSYMRRQGTVAPQTEYKDPRKGNMTPKDHARATEYGERAKQKYINKKKK